MTVPLIVLSFFAITAGWVGVPEGFPIIGGLIPNWFHDFISGSLLEHMEAIAFNPIPLLVSIGVALAGLFLGWLVYRDVPAGAQDPLKKPLGRIYTILQNKFYFDELYSAVFVRPAYWFAETVTYRWVDRGVIDGFLHWIARTTLRIGNFLRNYIDIPIVNGAGDFIGDSVKKTGKSIRVIQTGRVQEYLIIGMIFVGILLSFILLQRP
jgi:NADH-quinone oxidoreductase subunit L